MQGLSRRNLLRGRWNSNFSNVVRPPWIISEAVFIDNCIHCNACVESCETKVIKVGAGAYPELDFSKAECNFCGNCSDVCPEAVFNKEKDQPWNYKAKITATCLAYKSIECRICQDSCSCGAIRFKFDSSRVAQPALNLTLCNGCGACVSPCPVKAITIFDSALNGE